MEAKTKKPAKKATAKKRDVFIPPAKLPKPPKMTAAGGMPSKYTPELMIEICTRMSDGEPLAQICRDQHMPSDGTVRSWSDAMPEVAVAIARAREAGFDFIAADCLSIADQTCEGVEITTKANGDVDEKRADMLGHRKLRIETRLKLLAKWDPKRYGDKMALTDGDGKSLLPPIINVQVPADPQQASRLYQAIMDGHLG